MDSELVKEASSKIFNYNNYCNFINGKLLQVINKHKFLCPKLFQAISYSLFNGGKRIRPLLVFGAGECLGVSIKDLAVAACAVEFMHTYSLIHDDLPDMDNDDFRRGKQACHIAYGATTAILAGDALQCLAFEVIANESLLTGNSLTSKQRLELLKLLSNAAGVSGMVGGQSLEFSQANRHSIDISMLNSIHTGKTGALLQACIAMGMVQTNSFITDNEHYIRNKLTCYGKKFGNLFQACDDIKDVKQDKQKDIIAAQKKVEPPSITKLLGMAKATKYAAELQQEALKDLEDLKYFGANVHILQQITKNLM